MLQKILSAAKFAGTLALVQFLAPVLVADFPRFHSLTMTRVKHRPRGMYNNSYESLAHGFMDLTALEEEPEQLILKGVSSDPYERSWTLGIDLEHQVVGYATWSSLTNKHAGGSGDIGVVILGLPGVLVASPLLIAWGLARRVLRWVTGMDLHTWFVWKKIQAQVPREWHDQVRSALINQDNGVADEYWDEKRQEYEDTLDDEDEDET